MVKSYEINRAEGTPVTLELAKKHLSIEADFTDDDTLIQSYLAGAESMAENYVGHALYEDRIFYLDNFDAIEFEAWADASLTSVQYLASGGDGETYAALPAEAEAVLRKIGSSTCGVTFKGELPELYESDAAVKVTVATTCPAPVANGILLALGDLFERREDRGEVGTNPASERLWRPYKKWA